MTTTLVLVFLSLGLLRGAGKQKIVAALNVIGYYVFGFPIGVSLMFAAKLGIIGMSLIPQ